MVRGYIVRGWCGDGGEGEEGMSREKSHQEVEYGIIYLFIYYIYIICYMPLISIYKDHNTPAKNSIFVCTVAKKGCFFLSLFGPCVFN